MFVAADQQTARRVVDLLALTQDLISVSARLKIHHLLGGYGQSGVAQRVDKRQNIPGKGSGRRIMRYSDS